MRQLVSTNRFGLSWRPQLSAGILAQRDRVDCLEVIPRPGMAPRSLEAQALAALAREIPVSVHSIDLGLATTLPVEARRLDAIARLIDRIQPESWSEHLAFVRAGGIEIGHLAAPPRSAGSIDGTLRNLDLARRITGLAPAIENIATLIDPPASTMSEAEWLGGILAGSDNSLLLDLHNVYSNALNFGLDARSFVDSLPLERVRTIHVAGGVWTGPSDGGQRYLDDHLHSVPDPVFALLEHVAARTSQPLTVILERDGHFPPISHLLAELDRARDAVGRGREAQARVLTAA